MCWRQKGSSRIERKSCIDKMLRMAMPQSFEKDGLGSVSRGRRVALNLHAQNPVMRAKVSCGPSQEILPLMQVQYPMICYKIMATVVSLRRVVVLDNAL